VILNLHSLHRPHSAARIPGLTTKNGDPAERLHVQPTETVKHHPLSRTVDQGYQLQSLRIIRPTYTLRTQTTITDP